MHDRSGRAVVLVRGTMMLGISGLPDVPQVAVPAQ